MIGIIGDSEKSLEILVQIVLVRSKFEEDLERLKRIVIPLEINITRVCLTSAFARSVRRLVKGIDQPVVRRFE